MATVTLVIRTYYKNTCFESIEASPESRVIRGMLHRFRLLIFCGQTFWWKLNRDQYFIYLFIHFVILEQSNILIFACLLGRLITAFLGLIIECLGHFRELPTKSLPTNGDVLRAAYYLREQGVTGKKPELKNFGEVEKPPRLIRCDVTSRSHHSTWEKQTRCSRIACYQHERKWRMNSLILQKSKAKKRYEAKLALQLKVPIPSVCRNWDRRSFEMAM